MKADKGMPEHPDVSPAAHKRALANSDRRYKRLKETGGKTMPITARLKRLESDLYWYRNTVASSWECLKMLDEIPKDIEHYTTRQRRLLAMKGARFQVGDVLDYNSGTSSSQWLVTKVYSSNTKMVVMDVKNTRDPQKVFHNLGNARDTINDPVTYLTKNTFLTDVHNALKQQD